MSTLTRDEIRKRLGDPPDRRLVVTPLLSRRQLGDASIDVRLGNQFILFRVHALGVFSADEKKAVNLRAIQERQVLAFGKPFILHPGMLVLGSTFEYLRMPNDLECQVEGRSSWARVGLQVGTASSIEPGFKGVVTLELSNVGNTPLELHPGTRVAQLVFRTAEPPLPNAYSGPRKYRCAVGPEFSRLHRDKDAAVFQEVEEADT